jgi:hypothetical protein
MHNANKGRWLLLGILALAAGCHHAPCQPPPPGPPDLPIVLRGHILPDLSAVPLVAVGPIDQCYRALCAHDCQCIAVQQAGTANTFQQDSQSSGDKGLPCLSERPQRKQKRLKAAIMEYTSQEYRNRAAGVALEAYFRIAESEGQLDLLYLAVGAAGQLVVRAEEAQGKGLRVPVELTKLRQEQTRLQVEFGETEVLRDKLNGQLRALLGLTCLPGFCLIWPTEPLRPIPLHLDIDEAIKVALANRADLAVLRVILANLDADTLPVVRQLMGAVNPLLNTATGGLFSKIAAHCNSEEVESVRRQIETLLADRERQVVEDVWVGVRTLEGRFRLVVLTRRLVEQAQKKVDELQEKQQKGLAAEGDLPSARLTLYRNQGRVLHAVVDWHLAQAQLLQAQGLLVRGCEPGPPALPCAPVGPAAHPGPGAAILPPVIPSAHSSRKSPVPGR